MDYFKEKECVKYFKNKNDYEKLFNAYEQEVIKCGEWIESYKKAKEELENCKDVIKEIIKISGANECDEITGVLLCEHIQYIIDENKKLDSKNTKLEQDNFSQNEYIAKLVDMI